MSTETSVFIAISIFLFLSYFIGRLFSKFNQPKVVSEIFAGICLGPTLMGLFFPDVFQKIFTPNAMQSLGTMKEMGLILLMFCSGYGINSLNLKKQIKPTFLAVLLGIGAPVLFAYLFYPSFNLKDLMGSQQSDEKLKVIFILSAAVTSIPVISRILSDLNLLHTSFAKMILSTAIIADIILYATLNAVLILPQNDDSNVWLLINKHIIITSAFIGIVIFFRNKIYDFTRFLAFRKPNLEKHEYIGLIIACLLLAICVLEQLGIVRMISAFACGLIFASANSKKAQETGETIKRFSFATFIPIYFIMVGLKINLHKDFSLKLLVIFLLISSILKIISGFIAGKASSFQNLKAFIFGITLNARGGPGIVIASVSFEAGIINETLFVTLILTSLITSSITGMFLRVYRDKVLHY